MVGLGDTYDGISNDRGEVERSIGPTSAYINFGISGQPAADFANFIGDGVSTYSSNYAVNLGKTYTTNMIEDLGGGDCLNGKDPSATVAAKTAIWNAWTNGTLTIPQKSSSSISTLTLPCIASAISGNFTTTDQTDGTRNDRVQGLNTLLRAGVAGFPVRLLDIAPVVSQFAVGHSGSMQYLWKPNTPAYTVDGIYEGQAGCYAIQNSGIIDPCILCQLF